MPATLKPHQREVLAKLDNGKIMYGDMGVGKSITAAAYYLEREAPRDVYVITTAKKRDELDWEAEFAKLGMNVEQQTAVGGKLVVDSWNNLHKYKEVEGAFFIFDEQRVVGYGAWSKAFIHIAKHNRWILLSATPGDTWMDYIPVFIANGFYRNKADFVRQHVEYMPFVKHAKVQRYHGVGKLVRLRNSLLVHMPYERHTTREVLEISVGYDPSTLEKVTKQRWNVYENRPIKNVSELFSVARRVVNSDDSRLATVRSLLQTHPKLIVFYNFNYELEMLRSLGESNGTSIVTSPSTSQTPSSTSMESEQPTESFGQWKTFSSSTPEQTPSLDTNLESEPWENPITAPATLTEMSAATGVQLRDANTTEWLEARTRLESSMKDSGPSTSTQINSNDSESPRSSTTKPSEPSLTIAEWNGHRHDPIPTTDRWLYLVQYTAGSEGWNCVETDAMCFYSLTYSYRQFWQAHGRIDRLNTPYETLKYYVLVSSSWLDKAIWKALRTKRSFNETAFMKESV